MRVTHPFIIILFLITTTTKTYSQTVIEIGFNANGTHNISSISNTPGHLNPYHLNSNNGRIQFLYSAAELNLGGANGATTLDSIGWYISSNISSNLNNYTIRLQNTNLTTLTTTVNLGWFLVRNAAPLAPATDSGWYMIPFDNPFTWDGTSNIIVDVCWSSNNTVDYSGQIRQFSPSINTDRIYLKSSTTNVCGSNTNQSTSFKPYIRFTGYCPNISTQFLGSICFGQSYPFNGSSYNFPGTYIDTFVTTNGCDSLSILTLSVNSSYNITVFDTICSGSIYNFGGQQLSLPGTYMNTFQSSGDCDSNVTLYLDTALSYQFYSSDTICKGDTSYLLNTPFTQEGLHTISFPLTNGCDSSYTLDLYYKFVDDSIIKNGNTLLAHAPPPATYQWYDCTNNLVLTGETGQAFSTPHIGSFCVIVTMNGCIDTSKCIVQLGGESTNDYQIKLFSISPNPINEKMEVKGIRKETPYLLINTIGETIKSGKLFFDKNVLDLSNLRPGIYFIKVENETHKILKE